MRNMKIEIKFEKVSDILYDFCDIKIHGTKFRFCNGDIIVNDDNNMKNKMKQICRRMDKVFKIDWRFWLYDNLMI